MTKRYLKDWAYSKIIDYQLTSKAFGSMALILREIFDLASDEEFNIIDRNIKYRSVHKIRKTVCSTLIDSGININTVREIMGHSDEETTLRNYTLDTDKAVIKALSIQLTVTTR